MKIGIGVALVLACVFTTASGICGERPIVAVFDIEMRNVGPAKKKANDFTDYLCSLLARQGFQIVPRKKLKESMQEKKKESYKHCYDQACQIEIGQELSAQKSLSTQVLKLGGKCKVTLTLYDLKRSTSEGAGTASGGCDEERVVESLEKAVADLMGSGYQASPVKPGGKPTGPKTPDLSEYERLASIAAAEKRKQGERKKYLAALEKAWDSVKKVAGTKEIKHPVRVGVLRKFLQDFADENPHEAEAKEMIAKLEKGEEPGVGSSIIWIHSAPAKIDFTKSEITVAQYAACLEAGKCTAPKSKSWLKWCNWGDSDRDNHPVNCLTTKQATAFCAWAGGRLPTEAEWEAEATNKSTREHPWGNQIATCDYAVMKQGGMGCGRNSTWPVCSKPAGNSVSGLCDMKGNVWEFTSSVDWKKDHVIRGGSYQNDAKRLIRYSTSVSNSRICDGFRCVRDAPSGAK